MMSRALTGWVLDPLAIASVVATAALYLRGVDALRRRGRRWPVARTASFAAGLLVVIVALDSGLDRYDAVLFSFHAFSTCSSVWSPRR